MSRSHLTDHYAIGTEDTTHQLDFMGGPKLENSKSNMADGRHLGCGKIQDCDDWDKI